MKFLNNRIVSDSNFVKKKILNNKFLYEILLKGRYKLNKKRVKKNRIGNIAMFHNGRVGSTVLADLLNQKTKIHWDGELFVKRGIYHKHFTDKPIDFLKYKIYQHNTKFYGFEIKAMKNQHLGKDVINIDFDDFMNILKNLNFKYFINIKRKNYLKQYISLERARKKNVKHTNKEIKLEQIYIDINNAKIGKTEDTLINNFQRLDEHYENIENKLKDFNTLHLTYEDDILPDPKIAYKKICQFLNIEEENPTVNLKRTNPFPVNKMVENYSDVENVLKGTKYEWMLYN